MKNILVTLSVILFGFLLYSCEGPKGDVGLTGPEGEQGETGATGAEGPSLSGSISGFVDLWDVSGNQILPSPLTKVSIYEKNITVACDSNGRWQIDSLTSGIYDLTFELDGYGTYIKKSLQFVGGNELYYGRITLGQIPDYYVSTVSATNNGDQITFTGVFDNVPTTSSNIYCIIFIGTDSSVSSNPDQYLLAVFGKTDSNSFFSTVSSSKAIISGIKQGTKIYYKAYGCSYLSYNLAKEGGYYIDPQTGRSAYSCLSEQSSPVGSLDF